MTIDIDQFALSFSFALPRHFIAKGLPRVHPLHLVPIVKRTAERVGFSDRALLLRRIEHHYSKMAIGPCLPTICVERKEMIIDA